MLQPTFSQTDALQKVIDDMRKNVNTMQSDIFSSVNATMNSFKNETTSSLDAYKKTSQDRITKSLGEVDETLERTSKLIGKVRTDADNLPCNNENFGVLRLKGGKFESCSGK